MRPSLAIIGDDAAIGGCEISAWIMITMRVVALLVPALIAGVASVAVPPPQTTAELSSSTGKSADGTRMLAIQRTRALMCKLYNAHVGM